MGSDTLQSVIDLAIQREEEAHNFYLSLSSVVQDKAARDTLKYLAIEEAGHKALAVRSTGRDGLRHRPAAGHARGLQGRRAPQASPTSRKT